MSVVLRTLGIPPGMGILFDRSGRMIVATGVTGSIFLGFLDVVAVAAVAPFVQVLAGEPMNAGLLARASAILDAGDRNTLALRLGTVVFAGFVIKAALGAAFRWWMSAAIAAREVDASTAVLRYFLHAPFAMHQRRPTADLVRDMSEAVTRVYTSVVSGAMVALVELVTIASMLVLLLVAAPVPAALTVLYFGLATALFQRFAQPRVRRAGQELKEASSGTLRSSLHALGAIREIKLTGRGDYFLDAFEDARTTATQATRVMNYVGELPKYVMEVLFITGVGLMTAFVFATQPPGQALGTVGVFAAAGFRILPSLVRVINALNLVRGGRWAMEIVRQDLADARAYDGVRFGERTPRPLRQQVELDHVTFRYPASRRDVLHDVSLTIPAGTSVALVGGSGAGKSTLVDLVLGLHPPDAGRILADGEDIAGFTHDWQAGIGLVPQQVFLLEGTLRENIAFGIAADEVDESALRDAIRGAQLDELVTELPDGVDTFIGEGGGRLSGGQRQRVGIARALYGRPTLLVLDEATSALDNETERRVTDTIASLRGSITVVVVAHRLSTVRDCDQIAFMSDGQVVASGTFDEVRRENAAFARLVELANLSARDAGTTPIGRVR